MPGPLGDRLRQAFLKPAPEREIVPTDELSVDELRDAVRRANDKERLIGLIAAPWAAGIGIVIIDSLIANDPAARRSNGQLNKLHVAVSLYHEVLIVLLVLALLTLAFAWLRKRLYLGIVLALYGLTVFNLRYWGFGVPFVMAGAWYLVRSYRLQRSLKEATGESRWSSRPTSPTTGPPRQTRRYTPPRRR